MSGSRGGACGPCGVSLTLIALDRPAPTLALARPSSCGRRPRLRSSALTRQAVPHPASSVSLPRLASERSDSAGTIAKSGAVGAGDGDPTAKVALGETPMLPAASACSARAVQVPSASAAGTVDHAPPPSRGTVSVCAGSPAARVPRQSLTVTFPESPVAVPAEPASCGRAS